MLSRVQRQSGQTTAEYLGVIVVVAAVVASLVVAPIGPFIGDRIEAGLCRIAQTSCEPGSAGGGGPTGGGGGPTSQPGTDEPGDGGGNPLIEIGKALQKAASAFVGIGNGLRKRASELGRMLRKGSAEARSLAARLLPSAGRISKFATNPVFRGLGKVLPFVGFGLGVADNRDKNRGWLESIARSGMTTAGGVLGGVAGGAACATETVASLGIGAVACPALVVGGGVGGGWIGEKLGDLIFGD